MLIGSIAGQGLAEGLKIAQPQSTARMENFAYFCLLRISFDTAGRSGEQGCFPQSSTRRSSSLIRLALQ